MLTTCCFHSAIMDCDPVGPEAPKLPSVCCLGVDVVLQQKKCNKYTLSLGHSWWVSSDSDLYQNIPSSRRHTPDDKAVLGPLAPLTDTDLFLTSPYNNMAFAHMKLFDSLPLGQWGCRPRLSWTSEGSTTSVCCHALVHSKPLATLILSQECFFTIFLWCDRLPPSSIMQLKHLSPYPFPACWLTGEPTAPWV